MPELPEVQTIVSDLSGIVTGKRIASIDFAWPGAALCPDSESFRQQASGAIIDAVDRLGKQIALRLRDRRTILVHLRMTGRVLVADHSETEIPFTRAIIDLEDGPRLYFTDVRKFGRLQLLSPEDLSTVAKGLGVDPLDPSFTPGALGALLAGKRTKVKPAILDQRLIAGIGNIYADESLFEAGINPSRIAASLTENEVSRLRGAIVSVLTSAVANRGTTFSSYCDTEGRAGKNQFCLQVYRRKGLPCFRCSGTVERAVVSGRGTHYCPNCQPL